MTKKFEIPSILPIDASDVLELSSTEENSSMHSQDDIEEENSNLQRKETTKSFNSMEINSQEMKSPKAMDLNIHTLNTVNNRLLISASPIRPSTRRQSQRQHTTLNSTSTTKHPSSSIINAIESIDEDSDSDPGSYILVKAGDCVLLDSGDSEDPYIALVSSVQRLGTPSAPGTFTAQWYYKPSDIREEVLKSIEDGIHDREVFLSPHKDKNSIDAVIGLCHVVPPDEYEQVQKDLKRGWLEESKPYFLCRFKYYPGRPPKKALEILRDNEVRAGLGPQQPKVGDNYQVEIPELLEKLVLEDDKTPWKTDSTISKSKTGIITNRRSKQILKTKDSTSQRTLKCHQVWSPRVLDVTSSLQEYRKLIDALNYAVGNVVMVSNFHHSKVGKIAGHVRCIVREFHPLPENLVIVFTSTGEQRQVLTSDICAPLKDDTALKAFYAARFNICAAVANCMKNMRELQHIELCAFKKEILLFSKLPKDKVKEMQSNVQESSEGNKNNNSTIKRRK